MVDESTPRSGEVQIPGKYRSFRFVWRLTTDGWLDFEVFEDSDEDPDYKGFVKWDGCSEIHKKWNGQWSENCEWSHFCDYSDVKLHYNIMSVAYQIAADEMPIWDGG